MLLKEVTYKVDTEKEQIVCNKHQKVPKGSGQNEITPMNFGLTANINAQSWAGVSMCHQQLRLCESLVWFPSQTMSPSLLVLPHHLEEKFL